MQAEGLVLRNRVPSPAMAMANQANPIESLAMANRATEMANLAHVENLRKPLELGTAAPTIQLGIVAHLISGGIAGALSKTCTAPLSRLTILFQIQGMGAKTGLVNPSVLVEASTILREEGAKAFWKGNGAAVIHRFPYTAISFYAYEQYQKLFFSFFLSPSQGQRQHHGHTRGLDMASSLVSGGAAGLTSAFLNYPLDLVRTRLAAQRNFMYYKGINHAMTTIFRDEGLKGLYKGLGSTLLFVGPNISVNFCAYESLKCSWKSKHPKSSDVVTSVLCGSAAGICSSSLTFPIDLLRRRMQLEGAGSRARVYGTGALATLRKIIRSEGFCGLYKGILPEYAKVMPAVAITFATYDFLKRTLATSK